ncbi:hypothetical protein [Streptacidiphilus sp. EB103A]|uniref:hypothetical protein n=1 Tax=Streptacidiphilus sp. EB103A TaxID=3156275 RepID=UPI0035159A71
MLRYIAMGNVAAAGSLMTGAVYTAIGLFLLMAGRHQRRMAASAPATTSGSRRVTGLVLIALSVVFLALGALVLLNALLLLLY